MSISKSDIKFIRALRIKKFRSQNSAYIVEGIHAIEEYLDFPSKIKRIYHTKDFITNQKPLSSLFDSVSDKIVTCDEQSFNQISNQQSPQGILAIVEINNVPFNKEALDKHTTLLLDQVRDPGNLGTLIRLADWFGLDQLICSRDSVDCFNPKVVQSTTGSLARINVLYTDLSDLLDEYPEKPVYLAALGGKNLYETEIKEGSFLILGNEARGISSELLREKENHHKIEIPKYGKTESLNLAVSGGIIMSEFWRRWQF